MVSLSLCLAMLDSEEERVAFEAFYNKYERFVFSRANGIVQNQETAEDVAQEVFIYVAKNFYKFSSSHSKQILQYLRLCTEGRALNYLEKEIAPVESLDANPMLAEQAVDMLNSEKVVMSRENIARMHTILADLPEQYRQTMELRTQEFEPKEIAEMLNMPISTIYWQIKRSCKLIRERMLNECES